MRALKTKYPCVECGTPCEVKRKSDARFIRCPMCSKRRHLYSRIHLADEKAKAALKEVNHRAETYEALLLGVLRSAESRTAAAVAAIETLRLASPRERRHMAKIALNRASYAQSLLRQVEQKAELLLAEVGNGMEVVRGEATPQEERPPPVLRLVTREEVTP